MTSTSASTKPKITIWVWSTGLYPRRVLYYFRAKGFSPAFLKEHNIHLVPVTFNADKGLLLSFPGHEERPSGTSLPIMRIQYPDGKELWIRETLAILEYLEDIFPPAQGYKSLRGESPEQAAKMRDVNGLSTEAFVQYIVFLMNSNKGTTFWSGLKEEEMHDDTAAHAKKKWQTCLAKLCTWVEEDVASKDSQGLVGVTTIADLMLMAQVDYLRGMYGTGYIEGHDVLTTWYENMQKASWYVENDTFGAFEAKEDLSGFLVQ
jgi:glutathione S-transferase